MPIGGPTTGMPQNQPATTQSNFRKMCGILLQYNPDMPIQMAAQFINDSYRRVIDYRLWFGLTVVGQLNVPNAVTTGSVSVTNGSTTITGVGTAFNVSMIGFSFRVGFSTPIYRIRQVLSATQLVLNLPWGGPTQSTLGYMIFQNFVSFGANVKKLLAVVNQRQGYRMKLHIPQEVLNIYDTWRTSVGWTFLVANYAPSPIDGSPEFELYPAPTFQQSFPFLSQVQAPDMVKDSDYPAASIRSDVIVYGAIPHALLFRGKNNRFYDPKTADYYQKLYSVELDKMAKNDDNLYPKDLLWQFQKYPFTQFGADWAQAHDQDSWEGTV